MHQNMALGDGNRQLDLRLMSNFLIATLKQSASSDGKVELKWKLLIWNSIAKHDLRTSKMNFTRQNTADFNNPSPKRFLNPVVNNISQQAR